MHSPALPPLSEWESFYVIVGSSAAALTGLLFVVIALGAEARVLAGEDAVNAYATPNVVHFCAVLLIAALLSTPGQTISSLRAFALAGGAAGLVYLVRVTVLARRQPHYQPVLSDWIWHSALPGVAYGAIVTAGVLFPHAAGVALDVVAGSALILLYVGIHNAWDSAVWMAAKRPGSRPESPEPPFGRPV